MTLHESVNQITTKEDLADFIDQLRHDLRQKPTEWENITLAQYLEAMSAWVRDLDGYYQQHEQPLPDKPGWKMMGEILLAAKYYE